MNNTMCILKFREGYDDRRVSGIPLNTYLHLRKDLRDPMYLHCARFEVTLSGCVYEAYSKMLAERKRK